MSFEPNIDGLTTIDPFANPGTAPLAPLPADVVFSERAVAMLRAYLLANSLEDYQIFSCHELDLDDVDTHLAGLGEKSAQWESLGGTATSSGELPARLRGVNGNSPRFDMSGCLRLARHGVVVARWQWFGTVDHVYLKTLWLCAAASAGHVVRLRQDLRRLAHEGAASVWQIVRGYRGGPDPQRLPRLPVAPDDLFLDPALRDRVQVDVINFFQTNVADLYRSLGVAYRRGVLLHGPPGNGKTSLIRMIGAALPRIPGLLLRPTASFNSDDLNHVITRWSRQAPAMLVIEDLNWLLKSVDLSAFLNLLDGIESPNDGGLLLLATTNHPDQLDPAINNRPGRFDVVIEVPCPDAALRRRFLAAKLAEVSAAIIDKLVQSSDGFSFAHLQELLRLSGLIAIADRRTLRSDADLLRAAQAIREGIEQAETGFRTKLDLPFGLQHLRQARTDRERP